MAVLDLLMQQLYQGIVAGSVYAMLALGLALVFGIQDIAHFAHGGVYALGAYVAFAFTVQAGIGSYIVVFLLVFGTFLLIGPLLDALSYRHLRDASHESTLIAALGLLIIIENGIHMIWGADYLQLPLPYDEVYYDVAGITILNQSLIVVGGSLVSLVVVWAFVKYTKTGKSIRAMAQNREAAKYMGISPDRVSFVTFAIASGLAAAVAVFYAPTAPLQPTMGFVVVVKAFVAVVLGGLGNVFGAVVAAYILGLSEALAVGFISGAFADVITFSFLIGILLIKPEGLFGRAR